jgi:hypothetical protein
MSISEFQNNQYYRAAKNYLIEIGRGGEEPSNALIAVFILDSMREPMTLHRDFFQSFQPEDFVEKVYMNNISPLISFVMASVYIENLNEMFLHIVSLPTTVELGEQFKKDIMAGIAYSIQYEELMPIALFRWYFENDMLAQPIIAFQLMARPIDPNNDYVKFLTYLIATHKTEHLDFMNERLELELEQVENQHDAIMKAIRQLKIQGLWVLIRNPTTPLLGRMFRDPHLYNSKSLDEFMVHVIDKRFVKTDKVRFSLEFVLNQKLPNNHELPLFFITNDQVVRIIEVIDDDDVELFHWVMTSWFRSAYNSDVDLNERRDIGLNTLLLFAISNTKPNISKYLVDQGAYFDTIHLVEHKRNNVKRCKKFAEFCNELGEDRYLFKIMAKLKPRTRSTKVFFEILDKQLRVINKRKALLNRAMPIQGGSHLIEDYLGSPAKKRRRLRINNE